MSFINPQDKEINCKLVYYGPAFSGKSTNLRTIYEKITGNGRGKIASLTEGDDRTLYFDFLPLSLGKVGNYKIRVHLYTVPGQVAYDGNRKIILKGVDGVVFVADSQVDRLEANIESWKNLQVNLKEQGIDPDSVPVVIQYNKRDLRNAAPTEEIRRALHGKSTADLEATALQGHGVMETLQAAAKQVLLQLKKR